MPRPRKRKSLTELGPIEMRSVGDLKKYDKNPRTHTDAQIAQIAKSIEEFGWTNPILVDNANVIIAGHARLQAAQQLGLAEVPTIRLSSLTAAQRKAYVMADNALALNAGWDTALLTGELGALITSGFDISTIGFPEDFLADLLADRTAGLTDPDEVPDVPEDPVSRPGDLWIMGRHRLLCGDATVAPDVERVLAGVAPHLMVTDPPWGVDYDPDWRNQSESLGGWSRSISIGKVENDQRADWREAWVLFPGDVAYTWGPAGPTQIDHYNSLVAAGFAIRMQIIWAKSDFPVGRGHYHVQHEPCWYAVRKSRTGHWIGGRKQTTLWQIANKTAFRAAESAPGDERTGHGTQKPVECMRRPIENNSSPGQAVYDPFLGSGTTVIAAEQTGRSCLCLEISPTYVDVSVERWQNFTGGSAVLDGDGRTFEVVAAARLSAKAA